MDGPLLDGLDAAQRDAVTHRRGAAVHPRPRRFGQDPGAHPPHRPAGADGSADAQHVLALTFTRRAASELQRRLGRLGLRGRPTAGTFHAVAWAVLRTAGRPPARPAPTLLDRPARLLETVVASWCRRGRVASVRVDARQRARLGAGPPGAARPLRRGGPPGRPQPPLPPDLLAEVFSAYADEKRSVAWSTSTTCSSSAPPLEHDPDFAAVAALALPAPLRRRVPGRQPAAVPPARGLARRTARPLRGRRPEPGDLRVERRRPVAPAAARPRAWAARRSCARPELPVDAAGAHHRGGPAPATARPRPRCGPMVPTRGARLRHASTTRPAPSPRCWRERRPGRRWSSCAVLVRTRAQVGPIERALRHASIPVRLRHDRRCSTCPACRRRSPRRRARSRSATSSRTSSTGWRPAPPRPRPANPNPPGSASCARSGASC